MRTKPVTWQTPDRIPDGDRVPAPGYRRWADLLPTPKPEPEPAAQSAPPRHRRGRWRARRI